MKTTHPKQDWQATRAKYTWHLHHDKFDRTHWWKGKSNIKPVAALYELARRHPSVGLRNSSTPELIVLGNIGLNSWPKLTPGQRVLWKSFAGNLKGVDCRNDEEKCCDIVWQDEGEPLNQVIALQRGIALPTIDELEAGIARRAIAAYRRGCILIAVGPDLAEDKAQDLFVQKYHEHRIFDGEGKQRARPGDWLKLISDFENAATSSGGVNSKGFNPYKQAVDSLHFQ